MMLPKDYWALANSHFLSSWLNPSSGIIAVPKQMFHPQEHAFVLIQLFFDLGFMIFGNRSTKIGLF